MMIGLIILAVIAILVFFGATERFFRRLGIANWLAFLLVLALVAGAVVPEITIGSGFSMNVGGFIVPLVLTVVLAVLIGWDSELFRSAIAVIAVASVAIATRMLIFPTGVGLTITASVVAGFLGGAVAFIIARTRLATLAAALGGIVLGDIITNLMFRYLIDGSAVTLGGRGVFDALIIAAVFGTLLSEIIGSLKRVNAHAETGEHLEQNAGTDEALTPVMPVMNYDGEFNAIGALPVIGAAPLALDIEAAADEGGHKSMNYNEEDYEDYFNDDVD